MAHFAEIDEDSIVTRVVVIANADILDSRGEESEAVGQDFCVSLFGGGTWKKTSYSGSIRKNYAGVGHFYDAQRDAFIAPQAFPSWLLNEATCQWEPPVSKPSEGGPYYWNEATVSWVSA